MTQSVASPSSDAVTFEILVNDRALADRYQVNEITVDRGLNKLPETRIVLADGDTKAQTFPLSNSFEFNPGNAIEIKLGYHGKNRTVFDGIILRQSLELDARGQSALVVTCGDKAEALTVGRGAQVFTDMTEAEALRQIISEAGLNADVADLPRALPLSAQANITGWEFIVDRAARNGMVVDVQGGHVRVAPPTFDTPKWHVVYGESLEAMSLDLDAPSQLDAVHAVSWSHETQSVVDGTSTEPSTNAQGNQTGQDLANVLNARPYVVRIPAPLAADQLIDLANARLLQTRVARFRGWVRFQGNAQIAPGSALELKGLGTRFSGVSYVSGIAHRLRKGQWITEARFGLDFHTTPSQTTASNVAQLGTSLTGLQIAKVIQTGGDPEGAGRIKVSFPLLSSTTAIWVRMAHPYATQEAGFAFLPEVDDEVVVGFLGDDMEAPVVLGALHSAARPPPFTAEPDNSQKGIVSRSKLKVTFDDDAKDMILETPGGHKVTLSDAQDHVTIVDRHNNSIEMAASGVVVSSMGDLTLSAVGEVSISGQSGVSIETPSKVDLSGLTISLEAQSMLTASGAAAAEVTSAGPLTLKGSLININ